MRPGRIVALVMGCLLMLPALGLLLGGGALGVAYLSARDDDGYFDASLDRIETERAAVIADDVGFNADPGSPDWVLDVLDVDIRLRVTAADSGQEVFVGIGRDVDVDAYLDGVAHDDLVVLRDGHEPVYRSRSGTLSPEQPADQTFWIESTVGRGEQELVYTGSTGNVTAVLMNADGSPGIAADVDVGARSGVIVPTLFVLLGMGALITLIAVTLIIVGASGPRSDPSAHPDSAPPGAVPLGHPLPPPRLNSSGASPVSMRATLDPNLSRWKWLVKWILAIPHFIVLVFLWLAFVVLTFVAAIAILFTGVYPRGIFDFNVGVLRWSWRVSHYASTGGIGTDEYPPFNLDEHPGEPASLNVDYPTRLSQWRVLVKWLLAIPHLIIVALLAGASFRWLGRDGTRFIDLTGGGGLLGLLVLVAGLVLLFTGRYPTALFDLIVGFNRWIYRVVAYVALMTDDYPPFRLDQGGDEPSGPDPDHADFPPPTPSEATPRTPPVRETVSS